jgi:hypothetical protein
VYDHKEIIEKKITDTCPLPKIIERILQNASLQQLHKQELEQ